MTEPPPRALGTEPGLVVVECGAAAAGVRVRDAREEPPVRWGCRLVALMQWVVRRDAVGSCHAYSYGSNFMYELARLPDLRSASLQCAARDQNRSGALRAGRLRASAVSRQPLTYPVDGICYTRRDMLPYLDSTRCDAVDDATTGRDRGIT